MACLHTFTGIPQSNVFVLERFTWISWPGVAIRHAHVDHQAQQTQPSQFKDLFAISALNQFTRELVHEEITHLTVFSVFLLVGDGSIAGGGVMDA